jgi:hypothetical protein
MTYIRECQALMSLKLLHPNLRDAVLKPYVINNQASSSSTKAYYDDEDNSKGPTNVSPKLWTALTKEYNDSQLRSIRMVAASGAGAPSGGGLPPSPLCLLQGPPGTGTSKSLINCTCFFDDGCLI